MDLNSTEDVFGTILLRLLSGILSEDEDAVNGFVEEAIFHILQDGIVPFHLPEPHETLISSVSNRVVVMRSLLNAYPRLALSKSERDDSLPLHFAASLGCLDAVQLIWEYNKEATRVQNKKGKTPLHFAAREGRLEVVNFLLYKDPGVAAIATEKKKLPLHFAASDGHRNVCKRLLEVYPDGARFRSKKGKNCLHFCSRWGYIGIATDILQVSPEAIITPDAENSLPLHDAVRGSQVEMCRRLVALYPEAVASSNMRGEIPLYGAARSGNIDLCALFLTVWPKSGTHILQSLSSDDCVQEWERDVIEMLVRGAVGNFIGCEHFEDRLMSRVPTDHPTFAHPAEGICLVPSESSLSTLETDQEDSVEPALKRARHTSVFVSSSDFTEATGHFLLLHSAIEANVSKVAMEHIWCLARQEVETVDRSGRSALHLAVTLSSEHVQFVLEVIETFPSAAALRDAQGRLPLQIAIESGACSEVIRALLIAYPEAGVQECQSLDLQGPCWPVDLACNHDADINVVYHLLRFDPSFVQRQQTRTFLATASSE